MQKTNEELQEEINVLKTEILKLRFHITMEEDKVKKQDALIKEIYNFIDNIRKN